jgi:hypothetical protein
MATPPNREQTDASTQDPKKPLNWGVIALGGCFGLLAVLSPIILMVLVMSLSSMLQERETQSRFDQGTAEAAAPVCLEAPPGVLARIEAELRTPDIRLRGVRAVRSTVKPQLWVVAAEVESVGVDPGPPYYERDDNFAVWHLAQRNPADASPDPDDPITAATGLAIRVSTFPSNLDTTLNGAAVSCTVAALSGA